MRRPCQPDSRFRLYLLVWVFVGVCGFRSFGGSYEPSWVVPPKPAREFRGVWIATVANLDWPSTNAIGTAQQKAQLIGILERAVELKLNVVLFQVRPACDAMYASTLEPWSEYLTGTMGRAPQPFYDPLTFAIEEAHKRGLQLHAWFNPYRARHMQARSPVAANHISQRRPDLVRKVGRYLWLDPGDREVQELCVKVVMDVVRRYDVDGVTFDDYFYPDKKDSGTEEDFPDKASWNRYGAGGKLNRDDWRRENVNQLIRRVYNSIKAAKPWVKFGVSPFGIWRPKFPEQIKGKDAFEMRFADSRLWLANGWLDYFAPQLYWQIDPPDQSFPVLLNWWAGQNCRNRLICPALNTFNAGRSWTTEEVINQIRCTRKQPGVSGQIHWRATVLVQNRDLDSALEREVYTQAALMPATRWLGEGLPAKPMLAAGIKGGRVRFEWKTTERPALWLLQTRRAGDWSMQVMPAAQASLAWSGAPPDVVALTAVDRNGNLSNPAVLVNKQ